MNKDRVRGMFLGIAIGDALGMPVEGFSQIQISEKYGRITDYQVPDGHKWFNGHKAGTTTDDCQLTLAVAEGLIESGFNMDSQVKHHVSAFKETTDGWGHTTRNAIRNLSNGTHWTISGSGGDGSGTGNGVAMKIAPVGVCLSQYQHDREMLSKGIDFIRQLNAMTHRTTVADSAALAHAFAVYHCCNCLEPDDFSIDKFSSIVTKASNIARAAYISQTGETVLKDDITDRFKALFANLDDFDNEKFIKDFGGGSCYVYNSLPFTYGFFLKNPHSIDSLYDVVSAGGDTDTNCSILGGLLGALHGTKIFPQHLIDGLCVEQKDRVLDVADRLATAFGF